MSTRLLIDVSNMAYRSWHTHLAELDNGVVFGFLRTIMHIEKVFATHGHMVFCFDGRSNARKAIDTQYKGNRSGDGKPDLYRQIADIRGILTDLGQNVWYEADSECDDLIANAVTNDCYIVSNDKDFHQLLVRVFVMQLIHNQHGIYKYTVDDLFVDYGCEPDMWPHVLALAGDDADNIIGCDGVGYKTAVKWFDGIIKQRHKLYDKIKRFIDEGHYEKNLLLTSLPIAKLNVPTFDHQRKLSTVDDTTWNDMCLKWSMKSLIRKTGHDSLGSERIEL